MQQVGSGEVFIEGKGKSYDEICTFGTDDVVLVLCNHRYLFYSVGSICALKTGLFLLSLKILNGTQVHCKGERHEIHKEI